MAKDLFKELNSTATMLVEAALQYGVRVKRVTPKLLIMGKGRKVYKAKVVGIPCAFNDNNTKKLVNNKEKTSKLLRSHGLPAPKNRKFTKKQLKEAWRWSKDLLPIVLKPNRGKFGDNVFVNIQDYNEFAYAFKQIASKYKSILIEQFVSGEEYRFTYVNGKIVAIAKRYPANVTGNGENTIEELISLKNQEKEAKKLLSNKWLVLDKEAKRILDAQGFTPHTVLPAGTRAYLRRNSNISTGGDSVDMTDTMDEDIVQIIKKAADAIPGLYVSGIDALIDESNGDKTINIIEINASPGFNLHRYPWEGQPRDVAKIVMEEMFPSRNTFSFIGWAHFLWLRVRYSGMGQWVNRVLKKQSKRISLLKKRLKVQLKRIFSIRRRLKFEYYRLLCRLLGGGKAGSPLRDKLVSIIPGQKNAAVHILVASSEIKRNFKRHLYKEANKRKVDCWVRKRNSYVDTMLIGRKKRILYVYQHVLTNLKQTNNLEVIWYNKPSDIVDNSAEEKRQQQSPQEDIMVTIEKVKRYHDQNEHEYTLARRFHYNSRMYFHTGKDEYLETLNALKNRWGKDKAWFVKRAQAIPASKFKLASLTPEKSYREDYQVKHPKIWPYNKLFFKALFQEKIFQNSISLSEIVDRGDVDQVRCNLIQDEQSLLILSTPAVNFLYHYSKFIEGKDLNPAFLLSVGEQKLDLDLLSCLHAKVYFYTHAIIGASRFYTEPIQAYKEQYIEMFHRLEWIVENNFDFISLDQKFEILVCAKLLGVSTPIRDAIASEAVQSIAESGYYFIDRLNKSIGEKTSFQESEHRNVLGIMAFYDIAD